jgi:predicted Zn-dependent protease
MERSTLIAGAALLAGIIGSSGDRNYGALAAGGTALGGALLNKSYGRDAERESDYYGIKYMAKVGYDPQAAVSLQKTFVRLSDSKEPNWMSGMFASHPPSQERVRNNQRLVNQMKSHGGFIGKKEYQRNLASLIKSKDAYKAYDEGVVAIEKQDSVKAMRLANKAIKSVPKEALFYSLKGDAYFIKDDWDRAYTFYNKAISLNDQFYRFYLERGMTEIQRGNEEKARRDIEKSKRLLPTKIANQLLGYLGR